MMIGGGRLRSLSSSARSREFSAASTDSISLLLSSSSSIQQHDYLSVAISVKLFTFFIDKKSSKRTGNYGDRERQFLGHDAGQTRTQISSMSTINTNPWL